MTTGRVQSHKRRSWRRVVLLALLLLVCGAMVNVAVAWGCALWAPWPSFRDDQITRYTAAWPMAPSPDWPSEARIWGYANVSITVLHAVQKIDDTRNSVTQDVIKAGLPFRSLGLKKHGRMEFLEIPEDWAFGQPPDSWQEGWLVPGTSGEFDQRKLIKNAAKYVLEPHQRVVPLIPLWPGFSVNTLFYAALLWLPIRGPFVVRRWRRRRRGLCVVCGYDLRGSVATTSSSVCPECGVTTSREC